MTAFLTNLTGGQLPLAGTTILGRRVGCCVRLAGRRVAPQHGVICRLTSGGDLLVCLHSAEGIHLNGARLLVPTLLRPGDVIHIGRHRLVYSTRETAALAASLARTAAGITSRATTQLTTSAVIAFSPDGRALQWASEQGRGWLTRYFPTTGNQQVAPSITRWLARIALQPHPDPLPGRLQTRQLVLRLVERIGAHCLVVATEEEVLDPAGVARRLHLSRREGEVLYWLAAGKDRTQVGQLLSISKRTVGKHCENLFPKLGVTNRAAAVRLVLARGALR